MIPSDKLNSLITDFTIAEELYYSSMKEMFLELILIGKEIESELGLVVLLEFINTYIPECPAKRIVCLDIELQINNCKNDEGC